MPWLPSEYTTALYTEITTQNSVTISACNSSVMASDFYVCFPKLSELPCSNTTTSLANHADRQTESDQLEDDTGQFRVSFQ